MSRHYFGTDGIRGRVGGTAISPEFVVRLGHAAGKVLARHSKDEHPTVLIGKDTRISGYMLEASLQAGFSSAGVDIVPAPNINGKVTLNVRNKTWSRSSTSSATSTSTSG